MATVDMSREYPTERKALWDQLTDPEQLPTFYNNMIEARSERFTEPGDTVDVTYRLLGRNVAGTITLTDIVPGERLHVRGEIKGLPPVEHDWRYEDTDDGTRVSVRLETQEVESWLGRSLDRLLIPRQLEKDLSRSLDNIDTILEVQP